MKNGFLHKYFFPHEDRINLDIELYLRDFANGKFDKVWFFGIADTEGGKWLLQDMIQTPHALFAGQTGSGKSASCSTTITTWMLANAYRTQMFVCDTKKSADDYAAIFHLKNVYRATNGDGELPIDTSLKRVIDLGYSEYEERVKAFAKVGVNDLNRYEQKTGVEVSRVVILIEEFSGALEEFFNYSSDKDKKYTAANKFFYLMRAGRSYGIWIIAAAQKTTSGDIPTDLVNSFANKLIFKLGTGESQYVLGDDRAARLDSNIKGRCYTERDMVQFPKMNIDTQKALVKTYVDPERGCEARSFFLTEKRVRDYLSGKSPIDTYRIRKKIEIVEAIEQMDGDAVIEIMHEQMGHKFEGIDPSTDLHGVNGIATNKEGKRIVTLYHNSKKLGNKIISNLVKAVKEHKCDYGLLYCLSENLNKAVYAYASDNNLKILDHDDMRRIARMIDGGKGELADKMIEKIANVDDEDFDEGFESDDSFGEIEGNKNKKPTERPKTPTPVPPTTGGFFSGIKMDGMPKLPKKEEDKDDYRKEFIRPSSLKIIKAKKEINKDRGIESMISPEDVDKFLEELGFLKDESANEIELDDNE